MFSSLDIGEDSGALGSTENGTDSKGLVDSSANSQHRTTSFFLTNKMGAPAGDLEG